MLTEMKDGSLGISYTQGYKKVFSAIYQSSIGEDIGSNMRELSTYYTAEALRALSKQFNKYVRLCKGRAAECVACAVKKLISPRHNKLHNFSITEMETAAFVL